jgi:hypothetical protein
MDRGRHTLLHGHVYTSLQTHARTPQAKRRQEKEARISPVRSGRALNYGWIRSLILTPANETSHLQNTNFKDIERVSEITTRTTNGRKLSYLEIESSLTIFV